MGATDWLDTAADWAGSAGNLLSAAKPFLDIGGAIYGNNVAQNAISSGFNQYKDYAAQSLNALGQTYREGRGALQPYLRAGSRGLAGYQNLLRNPNQITNDPGYQLRFNQGAEGMRRQLAAGGFRGSGRSAIELTKYGQEYATSEYDKALSRYLPMVQAGQTATGQFTDLGRNYSYGVGQINNALGEAATGAAAGSAKATTGLVSDFLGMTRGPDNPFGKAADAYDKYQSAADIYNGLSTAGGGNPLSALNASMPWSGNEWALASGPNQVASNAPFYGSQTITAGLSGTATGIGTSIGNGMYVGADGLITQLGSGASNSAVSSAVGASNAAKLGSVTNFLSSAPGMGIVAGIMTGITTGDWKKAALVGGGTYGGAALGTAIMPGIGTLIGGALGGLLGGSIGPKPSDKAQGWSVSNGTYTKLGALGGSKFSSSMRQGADALAKQVMTMQSTIKAIFPGVKFAKIGGTFGERDGLRLVVNGKEINYGYNQKAFALGVAKALTGSIKGLTAKQIAAISKVNFSNLALAKQQLQYIKTGIAPPGSNALAAPKAPAVDYMRF